MQNPLAFKHYDAKAKINGRVSLSRSDAGNEQSRDAKNKQIDPASCLERKGLGGGEGILDPHSPVHNFCMRNFLASIV